MELTNPDLSRLSSDVPEVAPAHVEYYLGSFPDYYYRSCTYEQHRLRCRLLGCFLTGLRPCVNVSELVSTSDSDHDTERHEVDDEKLDTICEVTIVAYDYPGEFSLLCGLLGAFGLNISSGEIYTSKENSSAASRIEAETAQERRRRLRRRSYGGRFAASSEQNSRRIILDTFRGRLQGHTASELEERLTTEFTHLYDLIAQGSHFDEVKQRVNSMVAEAIARTPVPEHAALNPIEVTDDRSAAGGTQLRIVSEDTPFFLYALSTAFVLHDVSVERVEIHTRDQRIEDRFLLARANGEALDRELLDHLKLSALFTKQFTFFLDHAPDPYTALLRFESLLTDMLDSHRRGNLTPLLLNDKVLADLARLLGASDYLWEDFIRRQSDNLIPLLANDSDSHMYSTDPSQLSAKLRAALKEEDDYPSKVQALNRFKDQENYRIDLDHILRKDLDFFFLSSRLTALAELVVETALELAWGELQQRYGVPRTVAGIQVPYAVFGLGKMGGEALGYASDIELLFTYSDVGRTDGNDSIENTEFFERFFTEAVSCIQAKREGIFQIDLRLRPHGNAGPVAASLAQFITYYRNEAHSYEKLALVRMRYLCGDVTLGQQVLRIRDDLVYAGDSIDLAELADLRHLQIQEKSEPGRLNAKFSPGGLVDLEYSVQILQIRYGRSNVGLRQPGVHAALRILSETGTISATEAEHLVSAYRFLRTVINGLRMLRGNARDLFLPAVDSPEYAHLAGRCGYRTGADLSAARQLHLDFETKTATVRSFVEIQLEGRLLPRDAVGTVADLILTPTPARQRYLPVLSQANFKDETRALANIDALSGTGEQRYAFATLSILAWDTIQHCPDPDMALNNWERFVSQMNSPKDHFDRLLQQPKRLEILVAIFAGSQFLADTLIRNPGFFDYVTDPALVAATRTRKQLKSELEQLTADVKNHDERLRLTRVFRRREILRIGTRDICLHAELSDVCRDLSNLADTLLAFLLDAIWLERPPAEQNRSKDFVILAFGKLGGRELNYSSDIDLLGVYRPEGTGPDLHSDREERLFSKIMQRLRADLSDFTADGYLYRVDLRLRPFGNSGPLVYRCETLLRYYRSSAGLWEHQALLKLRPVAGELELGWEFLRDVRPLMAEAGRSAKLAENIRFMRETSVSELPPEEWNIKSGIGGIRDIEFAVQFLQMRALYSDDAFHNGNTLHAIELLASKGLLGRRHAATLTRHYVFLRRIEHFLQVLHDRQVHTLPSEGAERDALAMRASTQIGAGETLSSYVHSITTDVHEIYEAVLAETSPSP